MGSSDSDDDFQKSELDPRQSHRVYLLTYSKENVEKFPSRQCFLSAVTKAFAETGAEVSHWTCCQEYNKNKKIHYHMAVNMNKLRRWKSVKEQLKSKHNINVHFSDKFLVYIAAYGYICKSDKENHPDLRDIGSPRTKACMKANKAKNSATWKSGELKHSLSSKGTEVSLAKIKTKRLTFTNVAEYILDNRIRSYTILQAIAITRRQEGEQDLFSFLARNTSKGVQMVYGACMVQQKRKIQKLFPEQKSWFQLETKNALPCATVNGCKLYVKYFPGTISLNLSLLLLFVNSWRRTARNV